MFCEKEQEKSQCFCVSSALLRLAHGILPKLWPISLKQVAEDCAKCGNFYITSKASFCLVFLQKKLFPLFLRKLLHIILLLVIFIFIPLAL